MTVRSIADYVGPTAEIRAAKGKWAPCVFGPTRGGRSLSPYLGPRTSPRRPRRGSTMATAYCCPAKSSLKFTSAAARSSAAPSAAAFVRAGSSIGSPLLRAGRQLRGFRTSPAGSGRGSLATQRLLVRCGVAAINQAEFPEVVLKSDVPVLVEFVADWCGPCRLISPVIEWASQVPNLSLFLLPPSFFRFSTLGSPLRAYLPIMPVFR